jgi:hypothetical protein
MAIRARDIGGAMFDDHMTDNRRSIERPSAVGMVALFVLQAGLSIFAILSAIVGGMAIASCDPLPTTTCNYGLATAAGYFAYIVVPLAFVAAIVWATGARDRGQRGIWAPLAGSIVVLFEIGVNVLMNGLAIPGIFGSPA